VIGAAFPAGTRAEISEAERSSAKRAALRIRAARRAEVAAAERIARLAFGVAAGIWIANQVTIRPGTIRFADAAGGTRIAAAIRITQEVLRTDALIRAMIRAGVGPAKQIAFRKGVRTCRVAKRVGRAEKRTATIGTTVRTGISATNGAAVRSRTVGIANTTNVAWITAARCVAERIAPTNDRTALIRTIAGTRISPGAQQVAARIAATSRANISRAEDRAALVRAARPTGTGIASHVAGTAATLRIAQRITRIADRIAKSRGAIGFADANSTAAIASAKRIATAATEPATCDEAFRPNQVFLFAEVLIVGIGCGLFLRLCGRHTGQADKGGDETNKHFHGMTPLSSPDNVKRSHCRPET